MSHSERPTHHDSTAASVPAGSPLRPRPAPDFDAAEALRDLLLEDEAPRPLPRAPRAPLLLASGVLLLGVVAVGLAAFDSTGPSRPDVSASGPLKPSAPIPPPGTSVARYEYERAEALR